MCCAAYREGREGSHFLYFKCCLTCNMHTPQLHYVANLVHRLLIGTRNVHSKAIKVSISFSRTFHCSRCSATFVNVSQLNFHSKTAHTAGEEVENGEGVKYPCTIPGCDHVAKSKAQLEVKIVLTFLSFDANKTMRIHIVWSPQSASFIIKFGIQFLFPQNEKVNNASTLQLKTKYVFVFKTIQLFSFYALPSGGKLKDAVVHSFCFEINTFSSTGNQRQ